jgi:hypothetical protein
LRSKLFARLRSWDRTLLIGIGNNQAGIHRKTFPTDQTSPDARVHHALKHAAEDVAVAEPIVARTRERRVIRNLILDRQPAKPTIGEVHLHIAAQRSLRADREHVADDQHPDHQFRVNRWPTSTGIIRRQLNTHPRQVEYRSYLANQVIVRNSLFKTK